MKKSVIFIGAILFLIPTFCQRVVVFPFNQSGGDIKNLWLESGISAAIEESLVYNGILTVPTEDIENFFKEKRLISRPYFPISSQLGLAREFGSSYLISGEYQIEGSMIKINYYFFDLISEIKKIKEEKIEGDLTKMREFTEQIAKSFITTLKGEFKNYPIINNESFESYIRGRSATDLTLKEVYFRKAIDLEPDYYDAKCLLAIVLKEENYISESIKILEDLKSKNYSKSSLGLRTLGAIKMQLGKFKEAKDLFFLSLKASENAEGHILLAKLYIKQGKKEDALREISIAEKFGTHIKEVEEIKEELK